MDYSVNDDRLVTVEDPGTSLAAGDLLRVRDLATGASTSYTAPPGCRFDAVYAGADTGVGLTCPKGDDQFLVLDPDGGVRLRVTTAAQVLGINAGQNGNRLGSATSDVFGVYLPFAGRVRFSGPPPMQPLLVVDAASGTVYRAPARTEVGSTADGEILLNRPEGGGPSTQVVRLP